MYFDVKIVKLYLPGDDQGHCQGGQGAQHKLQGEGSCDVKKGIFFCLWSLIIYYFCKLFALLTISFSQYSVISTTY